MTRSVLAVLLAVLLAATLAATVPAPLFAQDTPAFRVIVRADHPGGAVKREDLAGIFLKRVRRWGDGNPVLAVDQSMAAPVRKSFSNEVLRQPLAAIQHYWHQQVFSGREQPPSVRLSDAEVVAFVQENPGAIGYVSGAATLGPGVKALRVLEE
jgi:ABC-type phosphate transport system substrate-binding protein